MRAVGAETGLVLADQFRDGNVPAPREPLEVAKRALAERGEAILLWWRFGLSRKRVGEGAAGREPPRGTAREDRVCPQRPDEPGLASGDPGASRIRVEGLRRAPSRGNPRVCRGAVGPRRAKGAEGPATLALRSHPHSPPAGRVVRRREPSTAFRVVDEPVGVAAGAADRRAAGKSRYGREGARWGE